MVERISSGIPGLDTLIDGGIPKGSVTLVSGGAGTGKTIFCSQYLWHGLQNGENCLFVTLEEEPDEIMADAREFGWDFDDYGEDRFQMMYLNPFKDSGGFADRIREKIKEVDADRVVIDSTSTMGMYSTEPGKIRERLYNLIRKLRQEKVTAILTSEIPHHNPDAISRFGVEEFVSDGVIVLRGVGIAGEMGRRLRVEKMRKTELTEDVFTMAFTHEGLKVEATEKGVEL